jgi:chromate transporter
VWFALHALFQRIAPVHAGFISFDAPIPASLDPWALLLSMVAAIALLRLKLGVPRTLAICAATSIGLHLTSAVL